MHYGRHLSATRSFWFRSPEHTNQSTESRQHKPVNAKQWQTNECKQVNTAGWTHSQMSHHCVMLALLRQTSLTLPESQRVWKRSKHWESFGFQTLEFLWNVFRSDRSVCWHYRALWSDFVRLLTIRIEFLKKVFWNSKLASVLDDVQTMFAILQL